MKLLVGYTFQRSLFLGITTLLTWLNSTLLLKTKCFGTTIYMKTQCLQKSETQHCCRKENTWEAGRGRERVALIKSLIMRERKDVLEEPLQKIELKMSADTLITHKIFSDTKIMSIRIQNKCHILLTIAPHYSM